MPRIRREGCLETGMEDRLHLSSAFTSWAHPSPLMESTIPFPAQPEDACADDDSVLYDISNEEFCTDEFRMYEFKVRRCPKQKPHDWTQCPFAHCGERATRRDPRLFTYSGAACGEFRRTGTCSRGELCPYAHGVFECWLHPSKYKTQMCSDVKLCKRPVCFFAHSPQELRTPTALPKGPMQMAPAKEMPPIKQLAPVNVEAIAAEVEKLLGQKSSVPHQTNNTQQNSFHAHSGNSCQNAISSFLNSVVNLQQAVPGINVMQLLQAVAGGSQAVQASQDQNSFISPGTAAQIDLKNAIAQAQLQLSLQNQVQNQMNNEFARQASWSSNRTLQSALSMDNPGALSGPLASYENTFSPKASSLNAFSGTFSAGNSTSSASSLPVIPQAAPTQSHLQSSSGLGLSSSGLCNQHARGTVPVDWATIDNELAGARLANNGSERGPGVENQRKHAQEGLWSCEEWLPPRAQGERREYRPGQLSSKAGLKCADELHGLKSMDPLLDALPRDLTDMANGISNT